LVDLRVMNEVEAYINKLFQKGLLGNQPKISELLKRDHEARIAQYER